MNPNTNNSDNKEPIQPVSATPSQPVVQTIQPPHSTNPINNNIPLTTPKKSRKRMILIIVLVIIAVLVGLAILGQHVKKQVTTDTSAPLIKNTDISKLTAIDTACYSLKLPASYVQRSDLDPKPTCFVDTTETASETTGINHNDTLVQTIGTARSEPGTLPTQKTGAITLDQAYAYNKTNYFPKVGTVKDPQLSITIGGVKAYRTNFNGMESKTLVVITAVPPHPYTIYGQTVNYFAISLSTSANNGEQILQTMISNWQWK